MLELDARNKTVLIISDSHIPYSHPDYLIFLKRIKEQGNPDIIVHIGDEIDAHAMSFHDTDEDLFSAGHELDKAIIEIQEGLHKLFPKMYLLESNHGSMAYRKFKHHGIPIRMLKPLNELYETPLWSWHHEIILDTNKGKTYLCHGKAKSYGKLCKEMAMNAIQGHYHSNFEITWHRSAMTERYNMFIGCLVDEKSMAMAYAKNNLPKPILGCGWIGKDGYPQLLKMNLNPDGRIS